LRIDFVDLLMGSFVPHPAAYVVVIVTTLASAPVAAVETPNNAARAAAVCTVDVGVLPVSKARLLAFGNYRGPPASQNVEAQRFFDQGLVFGWGFNFPEAARSFRASAQFDPECALCRWGIAWALGPSINHDMQPADVPMALDAIVQARAASASGSRERALIDALATRYSARSGADTNQLSLSYATAMGALAIRYDDDADIAVLAAEAVMNAHAYDYWRVDGRPQAWTRQIIAWLERALALAPAHPGAHHYRIHLFEDSPHPDRASASAEQLGALAPIVGHLVHMPSHIFFRLGRYREAVATNNAAVKADHEYAAATGARSSYALHNLHFLWASALWSGDSDTAVRAADQLAIAAALAPADDVHDGTRQHFLAAPMLTQVRLHRWNPSVDVADAGPYLRGVTQFARGMGYAAHGDISEARSELELLQRSSRAVRNVDLKIKGINRSSDVLAVARLQLQSAIATARGVHGDAVRFARAAVAAEDRLARDDPPVWPLPSRHMLGDALLRANRAAEAQKVFSADLQRYPRNCVALAGLAVAERKQQSSLSAPLHSSAQISARLSHCPE
jgi:tetratricopeptide (TPR) repeat protein